MKVYCTKVTARGRGFTLIELLVVIAIIAILAAILFPVFAKARDKARQAVCMSNMKQIAMAASMYASDWDDKYSIVGCFLAAGQAAWPWNTWGSRPIRLRCRSTANFGN